MASIAEYYRNKFLSARGFYTGMTASPEEVAKQFEPTTMSDYFKMKEQSKQEQSSIPLSPLAWKQGRRKNKYSKYLR